MLLDGLKDYADLADRCIPGFTYEMKDIESSDGTAKVTIYVDPSWRAICPEAGLVVLWLNSPGDTTFAIDCEVEVKLGDVTTISWAKRRTLASKWWVKIGGNDWFDMETLPAPGHMLLAIEANEPGWHKVKFRGTHDLWRLHGCSIYTP